MTMAFAEDTNKQQMLEVGSHLLEAHQLAKETGMEKTEAALWDAARVFMKEYEAKTETSND